MSSKLFAISGGYSGDCVGTLDEVLEWAVENNVSLDELYVLGEKVDIKALIEEKYGD